MKVSFFLGIRKQEDYAVCVEIAKELPIGIFMKSRNRGGRKCELPQVTPVRK